MAIQLNAIALDPRVTGVREQLEEVGGRRERRVTLSGIIEGIADPASVEAQLDAIVAAASQVDFDCALSLRPGRRLWVRRDQFVREVATRPVTGSYTLRLLARDPLEESVEEESAADNFSALPHGLPLEIGGNAPAPLRITLVADSELAAPSFSDGERTISYDGLVLEGHTMVVDAIEGRVWLEGEDVTPYMQGEFPRPAPGDATVTVDALGDAPAGSLVVAWRNRWW